MNCESARESLGPYVDGELPVAVRATVESHLAGCPACAAEFRSVRAVAKELASPQSIQVPGPLWSDIESRLESSSPQATSTSRRRLVLVRRFAVAASIVVAVGIGAWALVWHGDGASVANASTVDFSMLLDALPNDAVAAFEKFLGQYHGRPVSAADAKRNASQLDFEIPEQLPGGFRLEQAYALRFGDESGAAARYSRNGEFLGAIFHRPVHREEFGTHRDYECVIGQHRGHAVVVRDWRLVHLTDATTCHCVLSRLSEQSELPAVMAAVAPHNSASTPPKSDVDHQHR